MQEVSALKNISALWGVESPLREGALPGNGPGRDLSFGPAYVRMEARASEADALYGSQYGPSARLRSDTENPGGPGGAVSANPDDMSESDRELLQRLKQRDAMVRRHENSHMMAAGGQAAGMPTYTYQTGPDGRNYAIGGSVDISIMTTGDHEADARRAGKAARAAMAAGEPSAADMETAAKASSMQGRAARRAMETYAAQAEQSPWQLLGL